MYYPDIPFQSEIGKHNKEKKKLIIKPLHGDFNILSDIPSIFPNVLPTAPTVRVTEVSVMTHLMF